MAIKFLMPHGMPYGMPHGVPHGVPHGMPRHIRMKGYLLAVC